MGVSEVDAGGCPCYNRGSAGGLPPIAIEDKSMANFSIHNVVKIVAECQEWRSGKRPSYDVITVKVSTKSPLFGNDGSFLEVEITEREIKDNP